jgi:hypothetical protein
MKSVKPEVGKTYKVIHRRKGTFIAECLEVYDDGGKFKIVSGKAHFLTREDAECGEIITTVNNLAEFFPVEQLT